MRTITVHSGALRPALLCYLVLVSVFAHQARAADASEGEFHLKGVLVSPSSRSALVNNTVLREGERVGNVEIIAIRMGEVEIRNGSRRLTLPVGSTADWDEAPQVARSNAAAHYGPVKPGETLSEIAENLLVDDVTLNQMMMALYDANRGAFANNINVLREGAVLQVPHREVLHRRAPVAATAEVVRHSSTWQGSRDQRIQLSNVSGPDVYGPVTSGETLSGIAAGLSRNGTTINQMMIALFEANPQAFDDNINLLKAGAVLRIPDEAALLRHSYETATATVVRHMDALRHSASQLPQPAIVDDDLMTLHDDRIKQAGAILLSMRSSK